MLIGCGPFGHELKYLLHFKVFKLHEEVIQYVHVMMKDRKVNSFLNTICIDIYSTSVIESEKIVIDSSRYT